MWRRRVVALLTLLVSPSLVRADDCSQIEGIWDVHIEHMSGRVVDEQWVLKQSGCYITGTVKTARRDYPLTGTVEENQIRVRVTVSESRYNLFSGMAKNQELSGAIHQAGDNGTFRAIMAQR